MKLTKNEETSEGKFRKLITDWMENPKNPKTVTIVKRVGNKMFVTPPEGERFEFDITSQTPILLNKEKFSAEVVTKMESEARQILGLD